MKTILILIAMALVSCGGNHIVIVHDDSNLIITSAEITADSWYSLNNTKYVYEVSDASEIGWKLYIDDKYSIGDTLSIISSIQVETITNINMSGNGYTLKTNRTTYSNINSSELDSILVIIDNQ